MWLYEKVKRNEPRFQDKNCGPPIVWAFSGVMGLTQGRRQTTVITETHRNRFENYTHRGSMQQRPVTLSIPGQITSLLWFWLVDRLVGIFGVSKQLRDDKAADMKCQKILLKLSKILLLTIQYKKRKRHEWVYNGMRAVSELVLLLEVSVKSHTERQLLDKIRLL